MDALTCDVDASAEDVGRELVALRQSHEESTAQSCSARLNFFVLWKNWLDDLKVVADKSTITVYRRISPEMGLHGELRGIGNDLQLCMSLTEAAIGASLNLYHDIKLGASPTQCHHGAAAFLAAAEMVSCYVRSVPHEGHTDDDIWAASEELRSFVDKMTQGLAAVVPFPKPDRENVRKEIGKVLSSITAIGTVGSHDALRVLRSWLSLTMTAAAKLISERELQMKGDDDNHFSLAPEEIVKTWLQTNMDISDFPRLSNTSKAELKCSIPAMIVEGLEKVTQTSPDEYQRLERAKNVLYDSLELLDMFEELLKTLNDLEDFRRIYHEKLQISGRTFSRLAGYRLGTLPSRRSYAQLQSPGLSFLSRVQSSRSFFRRICQDSKLYRLFVVLYGGISNLGYISTMESVRKALALEQTPEAVQLQIMELQTSCKSARVVREQFRRERRNRKRLARQTTLLESARPLLRLSYTYRSFSSFDSCLVAALGYRGNTATNVVEIVLRQASEILESAVSSLAETSDEAKCICACGDIDIVVRFLRTRKPFQIQVAVELCESLLTYSEPACREIQRIITSDCFHTFLSSEDNTDILSVVFNLNAELGGTVQSEQILELLKVTMCPEIHAFLEGELLASTICSEISHSKLPPASWSSAGNGERNREPAEQAANAILNLGRAAGVRWWGRLRWCTGFQHQFSAISQSAKQPYTIDLLFALLSTCRKLHGRQRNVLLKSVKPTDCAHEVDLLWQAICLAVSATAGPAGHWRDLLGMWLELERKARSLPNAYVKAQILLTLALVSGKRRNELLQEVIELSDQLTEQDASKSSQLLLWTLIVMPASNFCTVIHKFENHSRCISDPLERGRKLVFVSSLVDVGRRAQLVCDALEALSHSAADRRLALALRDMLAFAELCRNTGWYVKYKEIVDRLPAHLASLAKGQTHNAVESCKSAFANETECDVLLLAARLRDTLTPGHLCFGTNDEALLWQAVSSTEPQVQELAKSKLKNKTLHGYLDLSCYSALLLEGQLLKKDRFALEILPYVRCIELEAVCVLKKWVCDDNVGLLVFDEGSGTKVRDVANLLLAEEDELDINNTKSVIMLLKCDTDICRRRAEALLNDDYRVYYTGFVQIEWLYDITSRYLRLSETGDVSSTVVQWIYRQICHNDAATYSMILSKADETAEYEILIRRTLRVDNDVGQVLLDALIHEGTSPEIRRKLFISLCEICYNFSNGNPTATSEFFERLPEVCGELAEKCPESLRVAYIYTGSPEAVLSEANAAISKSIHLTQSTSSLTKLLTKVHCPVIEAISCAVGVLKGKESSKDARPPSMLIPEFQEQLKRGRVEAHSGATQISRESDALRRLLKVMMSRSWIPINKAFDPAGALKSVVRLEDYDPKVIDVIANWTDRILRGECRQDMLLMSALLDDLLLCLALTSSRTPAAFSNCVQDQYSDLPDEVAALARSNQSFPRRQAAMLVLANLGHLSLEVAKSLVTCLVENQFVSGVALKLALQFTRADTEAIEFICEGLKSGSPLLLGMICRLLSALASNNKISKDQRSIVTSNLNGFASNLTEDQPIMVFRPEAKIFDHPSLASVVGEALTSTWAFVFDDALPVPFQLGQPDGAGVYKYTADEATPIWYRYCKNMNCWYWTPYEDYHCWMPVSTLIVRKGFWVGQTPVDANQHCIRYLHQVNPAPQSDVININPDWMPGA